MVYIKFKTCGIIFLVDVHVNVASQGGKSIFYFDIYFHSFLSIHLTSLVEMFKKRDKLSNI